MRRRQLLEQVGTDGPLAVVGDDQHIGAPQARQHGGRQAPSQSRGEVLGAAALAIETHD